MDQWIDATKQLPEEDGRYLCYYGQIFIGIYTVSSAKWEKENIHTGYNQTVSHWMQLPKPPGAFMLV